MNRKMIPHPQMVTVHKWCEPNIESILNTLFSEIVSPVNLIAAFVELDEEHPEEMIAEWKALVANTFYYKYETMKLVPKYHFENDGDNSYNNYSINSMKTELRLRSKAIMHKYALLAQTLPPMVDTFDYSKIDLFLTKMVNNYSVTTDNDASKWKGKTKTETTGQTSRDHSYTNTLDNTQTYSETTKLANDEAGSYKNVSEVSGNRSDNTTVTEHNTRESDTTIYGADADHPLTVTEIQLGSDKDNRAGSHFHQTKEGFYNSGAMSKIMDDIRKYADFNILEQYVAELTDHITAYYE